MAFLKIYADRWLKIGLAWSTFFICPIEAWSADKEELLLKVRCRSGEYRCGNGMGETQEKARLAARADLAHQIKMQLTVRQEMSLNETMASLTSTYKSESSMVSVLHLEGLTYHDFPPEDGNYRCIAMISEVSFQAGMDKQRRRIRSMVAEARKAAVAGHIDDALRLGYWASLLCNTIDTLQVDWGQVRISDPKLAIQESLAKIISGIELIADPAINDGVLIGVPIRATYLGKPARFDMEIYTGAGMDYPHVDNGRGYIELHWDPSTWDQRQQILRPSVLYAYEGKMRSYPDLLSLHEREAKLNTDLSFNVNFPFVKSENKPVEKTHLETVGPINVLAGIGETNAFLQALRAYAKDGRLAFHRVEPSVDMQVFAAVANADEILGVFQRRPDGFHNVVTGYVLGDLKDYTGSYTIWISGISR